ncbi:PQQ-binding-like beta-propeller repeat protein [Streptomyces sp. NPDC097727]|uniref:outer membrane protein assembly factor BamB family protein n=1 Tax=Streptomyces sp. NPDC097727 TaxID=3366092 RepID=UPI0037F67793
MPVIFVMRSAESMGGASGRARTNSKKLPPGLPGRPAVADGTVYVVGESGVLYAVGAEDGQERRRQPVGHSGAPVVADGLLYVVHHPANLLRDASRIRALDAATGEERWERQLPDGPPQRRSPTAGSMCRARGPS